MMSKKSEGSNLHSSKLSPGLATSKRSMNLSSDMVRKRGSRGSKESEKRIEVGDLIILHELKESTDGKSNYKGSRGNINAFEVEGHKEPQSMMLANAYPTFKRKNTDIGPRRRVHTFQQKTTKELRQDEDRGRIG